MIGDRAEGAEVEPVKARKVYQYLITNQLIFCMYTYTCQTTPEKITEPKCKVSIVFPTPHNTWKPPYFWIHQSAQKSYRIQSSPMPEENSAGRGRCARKIGGAAGCAGSAEGGLVMGQRVRERKDVL